MSSQMRIELLTKDNYDSWSMQVEALMTKNGTLKYTSGESPAPAGTDEASREARKRWIQGDKEAKSDLILSISPPELQQIRGCITSREIWLKLQGIYASRGPARKATLLKKLVIQKLQEGEDVRDHMNRFFDAVDKLVVMGVDVNKELLSILLLYSLPPSFENFRCAIESRDELPDVEALKVKILEESEARCQKKRDETAGAMVAWKKPKGAWKKHNPSQRNENHTDSNTDSNAKVKCFKCRKFGHRATECPRNANKGHGAKAAQEPDAYIMCEEYQNTAFKTDYKDSRWCLDSGSTSHVCHSEDTFVDVTDIGHEKLNLASNASADIKARGTVQLNISDGSASRTVNLEETLLVPNLRTNLISVSKITDRGNEVVFRRNEAIVRGPDGSIKMVADRVGSLYYARSADGKALTASEDEDQKRLALWHRRMGHLNIRDLVEMTKKELVSGVSIGRANSLPPCDTCMKGKLTSLSFAPSTSRSTKKLNIIHTDLCGPMRVQSKGGALYFITFIDDCTRWCEVYFIKQKSDVLNVFKEFKAYAEKQSEERIKHLQSDNGREYCNGEFDTFLKQQGIRRRLTVPHTPQQNGVAERKNRSLIEIARCILFQGNLQMSFWAEAVHAANYIRNRCVSRSLGGRTPYEGWTGRTPNLKHLRVIGTKAYVLDKTPAKGKFDTRSKEGILVGYSEITKGYRIWVPSDNRVVTARDVRFDTELDMARPNEKLTLENLLEDDSDIEPEGPTAVKEIEFKPNANPQESDVESIGVRRAPGRPRIIRTGSRGRPRKEFRLTSVKSTDGVDIGQKDPTHESNSEDDDEVPSNNDDEDKEDDVFHEANFIAATANMTEVQLQEALVGPLACEWMDAIMKEFKSILSRDTWKLVERPQGRNVVGCRVVLTTKLKPDGTLSHRKARLVARGFSQRPGIDFMQTFAPVARLESMRLMMALAVRRNMKIHQLDIVTAYLNGLLDEEVYMEKPEILEEILQEIIRRDGKDSPSGAKAARMLEDAKDGNRVCLLLRALYGLRQAGRKWHETLDSAIRRLGLVPTNADPCIYVAKRDGTQLIVLVYVDDILICSQDELWIKAFCDGLAREFEVKRLGSARYCLGIEITQDGDGISLSQQKYIREILERFHMKSCNPVSTPGEAKVRVMDTKKIQTGEEGGTTCPYRELVEALMYLSIATRPDIAYITSHLAQFNHCFTQEQWGAAKRVLRYLQGTSNLCLCFRKTHDGMTGYSDADWGNCPINRRSYTGYSFILSGAAVSWKAQKQRTVALSSTEAEYMALAETAKEAAYLRTLLQELGNRGLSKITVFCDNPGAQILSENSVFHSRTKHIDIRHHYVRQAVKSGILTLKPIPTTEMVADIFTKSLPKPKHYKCIESLGLRAM